MGKLRKSKNCQRGERAAEAMFSAKNLGSAPERQVKELALDSSLNHSDHENGDRKAGQGVCGKGVSFSYETGSEVGMEGCARGFRRKEDGPENEVNVRENY